MAVRAVHFALRRMEKGQGELMKAEFTVVGEPKGKGRPRFARMGNYVRTYTPQDTVNYENLVKLDYQNWCGNTFFEKDTPIKMTVTAYYAIPKSASKKKREQMLLGLIRPTKKPDVDNLIKALCDGLNGVAYHDDTQIVDLYAYRYYSETPRVEVILESVGGES